MDIQDLRQSLKMKWLSYYEQNRSWLVKMKVWATYNGLRRPSSGFILATLSVLEPQFEQTLAFIMELNNNPDEIVAALGLNFNPDVELRLTESHTNQEKQQTESEVITLNEFALKNASHKQHWENQPVLSLVHKPLRSPTETQEADKTHQLEPAVLSSGNAQTAISYATSKVNAVSSNFQPGRSPAIDRRSSPSLTMEAPDKTKPLASLRLALATENHRNGKAVRVLEIITNVSSQPKTLPSPTLATEVTQNGQYTNKQTPAPSHKVQPSLGTNASSLASWVDEFCQGTGCY
ncbi:hypothetical protein H6G49_26650 [Nostoc sp. PCC 7120 = FACHB-418]|uniref:DUF5331 domain-containing protein n=1 Tax=Nostoc sp. (strain PCC 7120 / SAG 25.82 / UTEX 2576) TaxID=103690 RepID=UPI001684CB61|nr:DUF5331 domain-containing protein [Nostoc sp. PCC 7120 = FACHB-418]MBD2276128.1 hypothetical protein [Nostoc sp. PCC 7120 = FACHB-418]